MPLTVQEMRTRISTFQYSVSHNALILSVISLECRNFKRSRVAPIQSYAAVMKNHLSSHHQES